MGLHPKFPNRSLYYHYVLIDVLYSVNERIQILVKDHMIVSKLTKLYVTHFTSHLLLYSV